MHMRTWNAKFPDMPQSQQLFLLSTTVQWRDNINVSRHISCIFHQFYWSTHFLDWYPQSLEANFPPFEIRRNCWLWWCSLFIFQKRFAHRLALLSRKLVSMHHSDPCLYRPFHYSLTPPVITPFTAYSTVALSGSHRGLKHQRNANGKSKETVKWTATLCFPPNAPERWITVNWHLEACGICLFMWSFHVDVHAA